LYLLFNFGVFISIYTNSVALRYLRVFRYHYRVNHTSLYETTLTFEGSWFRKRHPFSCLVPLIESASSQRTLVVPSVHSASL